MLYKDIAPLVAVDAMGAPQPRVIGALAQAANEFFRRTHGYKLTMPLQPIEVGQTKVSLYIPATTTLVAVTEVRYNGSSPLTPTTTLQLPSNWETLTGVPDRYLVGSFASGQDYVDETYIDDDYLAADPTAAPPEPKFDTVRFVPYPNDAGQTGEALLTYAVTPLLAATSVPDGVGYRYMAALVAGAKSFVLADVDKPWSNPKESANKRGEFERLINEAMLESKYGHASTQARVRMRRL